MDTADDIGDKSYAGAWRIPAGLIDGLIVFILQLLVGFIFGVVLGILDAGETIVEFLSGGLGVVIGWLYFAILESSPRQATLGKSALSMIVTDLQGNRISFARATGRYFAKFLSTLILLIGYFMILFTARKQGLHDILAECLVLRRGRQG